MSLLSHGQVWKTHKYRLFKHLRMKGKAKLMADNRIVKDTKIKKKRVSRLERVCEKNLLAVVDEVIDF